MVLLNDWSTWFPELFGGLLVSLAVAGLALILGFPAGALLGIGMSVKIKAVRVLSTVIVEFGRGIPTLVFLYLVYYGLTNFAITPPSFAAAVFGIGLAAAAYSSDLFRAGFEAVPTGEVEAARALGMNRFFVFWDVVLPQGLRIALPPLIGLSIQVFQSTALAYQIALLELLSLAYSIGFQSFKYLSVFTLTALLYLVVALPLSFLAQRLGGGERPRRGGKKSRRTSLVPLTTTAPVIGR